MRGIVYSSGTSEENYQSAFDVDAIVFSAFFGGSPPQGTTRYADPVGPQYVDGLSWLYPTDEMSELILEAAGKGPFVEMDPEVWFAPRNM